MKLVTAGGVVVALAAVFGAVEVSKARTVETDNAHVDGNLLALAAKVDADIVEVHARDNQRVSKGQVLVQLDDRRLKAELAKLLADLESNSISREKTLQQGSVTAAERETAIAQRGALRSELKATLLDAERAGALAGQKLVSQSSLDRARLEGLAAQSRVVTKDNELRAIAARGRLVSLEQHALAAERRKLLEQIALARLELGYTTVRAPTDGYVVNLSSQVGEHMAKGDALATLLPLDETWVEANFKETEIEAITGADRVEVRLDAYPGQTFSGRVIGISPIAGAKRSVLPPNYAYGNFTRLVQRVPVRIRLDPPQNPATRILPGLSARVVVAR